MQYFGITPEQVRELQSWDADSRMAFDELAARLEFTPWGWGGRVALFF